MSSGFRLNLQEFEGPLDLLLYLVRKNDLNVLELSIAEIADQYIAFIEEMQRIDLDIASEYLVMAATLAWFKSRLMLPRVQEDDEEIAELRSELIEKLLEYERYKAAAETLDERPRLGRETFDARIEPLAEQDDARPWAPISIFALMEAFSEVLARMPESSTGPLEFTAPKRNVEDGARALERAFRTRWRYTLSELLADAEDRIDLIVRFLALLELVRLGELAAVAEADGGEIHIERRNEAPAAHYADLVRGAWDGTTEDDTDR
ncbi:MAG: segregation/condensation protein A [Candidatus Dadabacteria bacterium]|nr:MAG: segregation/condensation protein A [Candidatus Dadabacteria bacterium]